MRVFNRHRRGRVVGLLETLTACHEGSDAIAQPTSTGGEPGMGTSSASTTTGTSSGTTSTGEAASTAALATCGDGVLDPGEQCDHGFERP